MKRKSFFFALALAWLWAGGGFAQYYTDFEDWPIVAEGYWSLEGPGGWYTGDGVYVNFGNESSGLRKVGFNDEGDALELPAVTNPVSVAFWARLSSGPGAYIAVEYHDGRNWINAGSFLVHSTDYDYFFAVVQYPAENVSLRIVMTGYGNSIFLDDVSVDAAPLPVELTGFEAAYEPGRGVVLHWQTLSESNNDRFEVQRSSDGVIFGTLGSVAGAGTSLTPRDYRFVDAAPAPGVNYYRLRQVDADGTAEWSGVKSVVISKIRDDVQLRPTVVQNQVQIRLATSNQYRSIRLIQEMGSVITQSRIPPGVSEWEMSTSRLSRGWYLVQIESDGEFVVRRFLKL